MENRVQIKAKIKGYNIQEGKAVMQLIVDPTSYQTLPQLVVMTGSNATVEITSEQLVLFADRETGEIIEGQTEAFEDEEPTYEEPIALPPSSIDVMDDEEDEDKWAA